MLNTFKKVVTSTLTKTAVKLMVTILLFLYLFSQLNTERILVILVQPVRWILLLSFSIFVSRNIFAAFRNKILLGHNGLDFPLKTLIRFYFIGFFFNMFLPTVVGGDIARGYYLYKLSDGDETTVSAIIVERGFGILSMIFLSLISVVIAMAAGINVFDNKTITFIFIVFSAGFLFSLLFFYEKSGHFIESCIPSFIITKFNGPANVLRNIFSYGKAPKIMLYVFFLSLLFQFLSILSTYLISVSLGEATPFMYFMIMLPVIWLITMIPVSINGLGLREGAFVFLFSTAGMPKETAMAISLLWLAQTLVLGLAGGVLFLFEGKARKSKLKLKEARKS